LNQAASRYIIIANTLSGSSKKFCGFIFPVRVKAGKMLHGVMQLGKLLCKIMRDPPFASITVQIAE